MRVLVYLAASISTILGQTLLLHFLLPVFMSASGGWVIIGLIVFYGSLIFVIY